MDSFSEGYGINAIDPTEAAYTWRHLTYEKAKDEAKALAERENVRVIVFKIIGQYLPVAVWQE